MARTYYNTTVKLDCYVNLQGIVGIWPMFYEDFILKNQKLMH